MVVDGVGIVVVGGVVVVGVVVIEIVEHGGG